MFCHNACLSALLLVTMAGAPADPPATRPADRPVPASRPGTAGGQQAARDRQDVNVPVHYDDQAVVIVSASGVGAVRFTGPVEQGRAYRYRFLPAAGGPERTGDGKVFERYDRTPAPGGDPGSVVVTDRGSQLRLTAGAVSVQWSRSGNESGWLYFAPERERVYLVNADDFDELDLTRFAK